MEPSFASEFDPEDAGDAEAMAKDAATAAMLAGSKELGVPQPAISLMTLLMLGQLLFRIYRECNGESNVRKAIRAADNRRLYRRRLIRKIKSKADAAMAELPQHSNQLEADATAPDTVTTVFAEGAVLSAVSATEFDLREFFAVAEKERVAADVKPDPELLSD